MKRLRIEIDGMTCDHCVKTLRETLLGRPGVTACDVRLEENRADVEIDESLAVADVLAGVADAGFIVRGFSPLPGSGGINDEAS